VPVPLQSHGSHETLSGVRLRMQVRFWAPRASLTVDQEVGPKPGRAAWRPLQTMGCRVFVPYELDISKGKCALR